jgi:hypothetical protein
MKMDRLDLLNRTEETWKGRNAESLDEQSKKTAKEDLEHKMELAQRENKIVDSEDDEYQDAMECNEDGDEEEEEVILANNQEEVHNEADLLEWETKQDKLKREKDMRKFRTVRAENVQSQIFNEAGPHFKQMEWCSERAMLELESMFNDNIRDATGLSDTMLRILAEEVEDPDNLKPNPDYDAMYNRLDEICSNYALLYKEDTVATYKGG